MVKTLNLARPITRPTFLSRPRIWFSRSRLILTSNARLASSALTEWLSRSLTRTSLNQPVCMMRPKKLYQEIKSSERVLFLDARRLKALGLDGTDPAYEEWLRKNNYQQ